MAIIKCKMCGGDLTLVEGQSVAECEYCGSRQTVPAADNEKKLTLFSRANRLRASCDFDKAAGIYESIVADFPEEAEAYWGLVLCKYGIEYVDDPATGKKIPTCHRSSYDSVLDDGNFEQAMENADVVAQKVYREEAKQLERIRKGILEVSSAEQSYDIFICYKETDEKGDRTLDSVLAQDLYSALTDKGYRVFFSRITLQGKLGEAYEPYIFAALNSAKVMLAVGTCYEYYNAVWVKNEWSRYLKICEADKSKHLIPCFKDLDPEDMPREFNHLQGADLGKMGAIQDILFNMEKYIPLQKQTVVQERVVVGGSGDNKIASLLDRGNMALEDGDWAKADSFFEDVLNNDSKNAQAYLGKTLAQERCRTIDAFARKRKEATQSVRGQTLKLEPNRAHVDKMVQKFALPGYVEHKEIRKLYEFDLSYHSDVAERTQQYRNEEKYWAEHKQLSRAEKFAVGAVADNLAAEKKELFAALSDRVKKAEAAQEAAIADVKQRYETHLKLADEKAEALYQGGMERREEYYQTLLQTAKMSADVGELIDTAGKFDMLGDYKDSKNLAQHCHKRADEEQIKLDEEAERQRLLEEKREKKRKAKRRNFIILGAIVIAVSVVVPAFVIPANDYKQAEELLAEEWYEEAALAFERMSDFRDSAEKALMARKYAIDARIASLENAGFECSDDGYPIFGWFEQDGVTYQREPIEWIPLCITENKVLLISRYALDYMKYGEYESLWEESLMREWLNGEFMERAFTSAEQQAILETVNDNPRITKFYREEFTIEGYAEETKDRIFLLSALEVVSYFGSNPDRYTRATDYAKDKGAYIAENGNTWWAVRSSYNAMFEGAESSFGSTSSSAVRPVMWVDMTCVQRLKEEHCSKQQEYLTSGQYTEYILYCVEHRLLPDYTDIVIPEEQYDIILNAVADTFCGSQFDIRNFDVCYEQMKPYLTMLPEDYSGIQSVRMLSECMSKYDMGDEYKNTADLFEAELDTLKQLWDTEFIRNMFLADENVCEFMLGKWSDYKENYIEFYRKDQTSGVINTIYNLPGDKPEDAKYFGIQNLDYVYLDEDSQVLSTVLKFNFKDADTVEVYCCKDGKTYTLTREG